MKRPLNMKDLFELKCKKCSSTDVDLHAWECGECGGVIDAECNSCGSKYKYHDFIWVDEGEKSENAKET